MACADAHLPFDLRRICDVQHQRLEVAQDGASTFDEYPPGLRELQPAALAQKPRRTNPSLISPVRLPKAALDALEARTRSSFEPVEKIDLLLEHRQICDEPDRCTLSVAHCRTKGVGDLLDSRVGAPDRLCPRRCFARPRYEQGADRRHAAKGGHDEVQRHRQCAASISSAIFSATINTLSCTFALGITGNSDASTIRSAGTP